MGTFLSAKAVSLDGEFIENHIEGYSTTGVTGRESLDYEVSEDSHAIGVDGMEYYGKQQKGRTLTVKYYLTAPDVTELESRFRKLKIFCNGENRVIRFQDELNAHYTGTLTSVSQPDLSKLNVTGELKFYCPDPYLYSDVITTVEASLVDGVMTAVIDNDSGCSVFPTYRITHTSENGYIGIVHSGGSIEIGNVEESDGTTYEQSETLASLNTFSALSDDNGTNYMHPTHMMDGTLTTETISGKSCIHLSSAGATNTTKWHGGMRTLTIPADSNGDVGMTNFYCYLNKWFETGLMGQTGEQSIAFLDSSNNVICGYSLFKSDKSGNTACLEFWANGKVIKSIKFTPSYSDSDNPFNNGRGHEDIKKEGSKLTFYWWGTYPTYTIPEIEDSICTKVQIAMSQAPSRTTGNKYVTRNYLRAVDIKKNHVEKWKNVPNRYAANSEILINTNDDSVKITDMPANDEVVTGSQFVSLPVGETTVEFYFSSWITTQPTVKVEYRKRWL